MSVLIRLFLAFLLASVTFVVNEYWYSKYRFQIDLNKGLDLAELTEKSDEVLKRSKNRLIWIPVNIGDTFKEGEFIKTNENTQAKIKFFEGSQLILEPDTLIMIFKSNNQIRLKLIEGALDALSNNKKSDLIVETSDQQVIKLNEVKNTIFSSGNKESVQNQIEIVFPQKGSILYLEDKNGFWQSFKLKLPQNILFHDFMRDLIVLVGKSRKNLKETPIRVNDQFVEVLLPQGATFVQFLSKKYYIKSPLYRYKVFHMEPPEIIFPKNWGVYPYEEKGINLVTKVRDGVQESYCQVFEGSSLILNKKINIDHLTTLNLMPNKKYAIQVKSIYPSGKVALSQIINFEIIQNNLNNKEEDLKQIDLIASDIKIIDLNKLYEVPFDFGEIILKWQVSDVQNLARFFKILLKKIDTAVETEISSISLQARSYKIQLKEFGTYQVIIFVLGDNNRVLSVSEPEMFVFKKAPLIGPVYVKNNYFKSDGLGNVKIFWDPVVGAKNYVFQMKGNSNQNKYELRNHYINLEGLLPGKYQGEIIPIDQWGRKGIPSNLIMIEVPEVSSLRAPSSKGVKIK